MSPYRPKLYGTVFCDSIYTVNDQLITQSSKTIHITISSCTIQFVWSYIHVCFVFCAFCIIIELLFHIALYPLSVI